MEYLTHLELTIEFDRQVNNLLQKQYPQMAGISVDNFIKIVNPLRKNLKQFLTPKMNVEDGKLPFVIVITNTLVVSEKVMSLVERDGKNGVTILRPLTTQDFNTVDEIHIPNNVAYLLVDIDRGKETLNLPPRNAMKIINDKNRSPLTIDEGIAIVTHFPEFLIKNNCFSLLGSRTGADQRVPAIWINGKKEPNLGWCWDGNPHTWLGSASCAMRVI